MSGLSSPSLGLPSCIRVVYTPRLLLVRVKRWLTTPLFFPVAYVFAAILGTLPIAVFVVFLTTVPIIALFLIRIWAVAVLLLFVLWFGLYRYLVYEILYLRLKNWGLFYNSAVCSPLTSEIPTIRIVRLRSGKRDGPIECELINEPLAEASFEALSYVWGTTARRT